MTPALRDAALDPELIPRDVQLYAFLLFELDPQEFRPLKQAYLRRMLRVNRDTTRRALRHLVREGYLERGSVSLPNEPNTYRIVYVRGARMRPSQAA